MSAGKIIKFLRQKRGLTQEELSEILGVTKNSIQKYESNQVPNIKVETLRKLCGEFGVPPRAFIFPEEFFGKDINRVIRIEAKLRYHIENHLIHLNDAGLQKLSDYIKDLHDSGNYRKSQDKVNLSQDESN